MKSRKHLTDIAYRAYVSKVHRSLDKLLRESKSGFISIPIENHPHFKSIVNTYLKKLGTSRLVVDTVEDLDTNTLSVYIIEKEPDAEYILHSEVKEAAAENTENNSSLVGYLYHKLFSSKPT